MQFVYYLRLLLFSHHRTLMVQFTENKNGETIDNVSDILT